MRSLPDPDLSHRDALDYILDCALSRRAFSDPTPKDLLPFVQDTTQLIHRLTASCHLPEFTDHGLGHLCSLLERISTWTSDDPPGTPRLLIDRLSASECATLLLAVLFHDIGMLSQRPDDLPQPARSRDLKGLNDVPNWVRQTHIARIEGIVRRGLGLRNGTLPTEPAIQRAIAVAAAHGSWPDAPRFKLLSPREGSLAAMLAVADLLDEDSNRCDISTLLGHRQGSQLNRAHWIRHGLTVERVGIASDEIGVTLETIPNVPEELIRPVFSALRNHFRLALLYGPALREVKANNLRVSFNVPSGVPPSANADLANWHRALGYSTGAALSYQLLLTFFPVALLDPETAAPEELSAARSLLESVDLSQLKRIRGSTEARSMDEQVVLALIH